MRKDTEAQGELLAMLTTRRPHMTRAEQRFVDEWVAPLGTNADTYGNHSLRIGDAPIMWSCHTDTVHDKGGRQNIAYNAKGNICLHPKSHSNCLGADDTAGVWLMRELVFAKVPGLYVFHRNEERGGLGSKWLVKNQPELVKDVKYCIALDRKGTGDIINRQFGGKCCSDDFVDSVADQLTGFKKATGVFTDSANYIDLIGECTNLSVGYEGAHSKNEQVDPHFLGEMKEKLIHLDVSKLVSKRKPGEREKFDYGDWGYHGYEGCGSYGSYGDWDHEWGGRYPHHRGSSSGKAVVKYKRPSIWTDPNMVRMVKNNPVEVVSILKNLGFTEKELEGEIYDLNGYVRKYPH